MSQADTSDSEGATRCMKVANIKAAISYVARTRNDGFSRQGDWAASRVCTVKDVTSRANYFLQVKNKLLILSNIGTINKKHARLTLSKYENVLYIVYEIDTIKK